MAVTRRKITTMDLAPARPAEEAGNQRRQEEAVRCRGDAAVLPLPVAAATLQVARIRQVRAIRMESRCSAQANTTWQLTEATPWRVPTNEILVAPSPSSLEKNEPLTWTKKTGYWRAWRP